MAEGWIKEHRALREHWLWEDKPFARGQAFNDLLLMVNHKEKKVLIDGDLTVVKKGQRITSLRYLADSWGWSTKKVRKFLELLEKEKMITFKCDKKKTVVTIENWSLYQNEETQKKQEGNSEETVRKHRGNTEEFLKKTNKNEKNEKNDKRMREKEEEKSTPPHPKREIEKVILDTFGKVAFETWFNTSEIIEEDSKVKIKNKESFARDILKKRYVKELGIVLNKEIIVEE